MGAKNFLILLNTFSETNWEKLTTKRSYVGKNWEVGINSDYKKLYAVDGREGSIPVNQDNRYHFNEVSLNISCIRCIIFQRMKQYLSICIILSSQQQIRVVLSSSLTVESKKTKEFGFLAVLNANVPYFHIELT